MLITRYLLPLVLCVAFSASAWEMGNQVKKAVKNANIQELNCGYLPGLMPLEGDDARIWVSKRSALTEAMNQCARLSSPDTTDDDDLRQHYNALEAYYKDASEECSQCNIESQTNTTARIAQACAQNAYSPVCKTIKEVLAAAQATCNSAYKNAGMHNCKVTGAGVVKCSN